MTDIGIWEREEREREFEALERYRAGLADAPTLYRPFGYRAADRMLGAQDDEVDGRRDMTFVANEESEDRMGDTIEVAGWVLKPYKRNPVLMFAHNYAIPAVGIVPKVWVEGKQLLNTVRFDLDDEFAKFLAGKYERRVMRAESVGFRPIEFHRTDDKDAEKGLFGKIRFTKQELLEISLVPIPAHPRALQKAMGDGVPFQIIVPKAIDEVFVPSVTVSQDETSNGFVHFEKRDQAVSDDVADDDEPASADAPEADGQDADLGRLLEGLRMAKTSLVGSGE